MGAQANNCGSLEVEAGVQDSKQGERGYMKLWLKEGKKKVACLEETTALNFK